MYGHARALLPKRRVKVLPDLPSTNVFLKQYSLPYTTAIAHLGMQAHTRKHNMQS